MVLWESLLGSLSLRFPSKYHEFFFPKRTERYAFQAITFEASHLGDTELSVWFVSNRLDSFFGLNKWSNFPNGSQKAR